MIKKNLERESLVSKINEVKDKIKECNDTSKNIQDAKETLNNLNKKKKEFLVEKKSKLEELKNDKDFALYRVEKGLKDLQEKSKMYDANIAGFEVLKDYFKQEKVTSDRVLEDLQKSFNKAMEISKNESEKQSDYIKKRDN